jgi:SAM-dependent methyltransferase
MSAVRLSILIPVRNHSHCIGSVLAQILIGTGEYFQGAKVTPEILVVDDASEDESCREVEAFVRLHPGVSVRLLRHSNKAGRGAALRTAIAYATGDIGMIQNPDSMPVMEDYRSLLNPILSGQADLVLGSRVLCGTHRRPLPFRERVTAEIISVVVGGLSGVFLSDVMCSGKAFRMWLPKTVPLKSRGCGFDGELVVQASKRYGRFVEVPFSGGAAIHETTSVLHMGRFLYRALVACLASGAHTDSAADMLVAVSRASRFNRWMADVIKPWVKGSVLEFGAGIGNMTVPLSSTAGQYLATDTDPGHLAELRSRTAHLPNVAVRLCDFSKPEDVALYCQSADTIICLNVLEHIQDDLGGLANIRSCLKEGGMAIILVPQDPKAFGTLDEVLEHKRRYTRVELHNKMAQSGFQVNEIIDFNRATWPGWYLNSRLLRRRTLGRIQLQLFDLFVPLLRRLDHLLPWPATSFIVIGSIDRTP